ncbi:MAG: replicative DNA helicase [Pyrinomonadaceae bacterium]
MQTTSQTPPQSPPRDQMLERPLPNSAEAERAILGAIILDNALVNQAIELLKPEDFYVPSNRRVFLAMIALSERGSEINPILIGEELRRAGDLEAVGGLTFITNLTYGLPHFTNVVAYAKMVGEKSMLRQLVKAANKITSEALEEEDEAEIILDHAEQAIFALADKRIRQGFSHVKPVADSLLEKVQEMAGRSAMLTGLTTGFNELDTMTSGLQPSDLIIVAARPSMGKTALCLTLAQNAAIQAQAVIGVFSLEMSKESLVMRMLCSEGRVDAHRFRSGFLSREEWARLAGALGTLAEARIYIDDTPGISVLEMRAKARRLAVEQKRLDLIIVDYLQLMSGSSRRTESRQQEVSQISRELKGLAKELNVPLVALSQLSRAPEARTDHRPQLADLRECITGDAILTNPQTGARNTVAELFAQQRETPVLTLDESLKIAKSPPARIVQSGEKDVFLLRTATGREVRASANHPFLTINGWRRLDALTPGTEIAVPRVYPQLVDAGDLNTDRARLLGYLISDGSYTKHPTVSFIAGDSRVLEDARRICCEQFGFEPRDKKHWSGIGQVDFSVRGGYGPNRNPLLQWLKEVGIHGQTTQHKRIPEVVFKSPVHVIAEFIGGLYAGDGSIVKRADRYVIKYVSTSRRLLVEAQSLLLRLGILATLRQPTRHRKSTCDIAELIVEGKQQVTAFARAISVVGNKGDRLREAAAWAARGKTNEHHDRLPMFITNAVHQLKLARGLPWTQLGYGCQGKRIGRLHLQHVAAILGVAELMALAQSDIHWDKIAAITPAGREMTYDLMVPGTHNFIANDIILHNSGAIEQDADVVAFIYREEQYNRTEENAGVAEIIVAKQRNGPTGTAKLAFLKEFTRFENMWRE